MLHLVQWHSIVGVCCAQLLCMEQTPARDYRDIIDLARVDHFFWDLYRIGLGSTNTNMVSKHIDIGHIGVGNIDIVLVLTKLVKKISKNFDPKNCPKNGQKLPKFVKICQNLAKNDQNIGFFRPKSSKNDQYFWYWCCIGSPRKFFRCCIGLESIFGPKMTLVLVLGRKILEIFFYRIGLEIGRAHV